jgi:large subunit ribosomal protein L11
MSKKVAKVVKLQIPAGQAKPGSLLASAGVNMPKFCSDFNERTKDRAGDVVPVIITAFEDKSYEMVIKTTPTANLIKKAAGIDKGSATPNKTKAGSITAEDVKKIAQYKLVDLSANDLEAAIKIIEGTAKNMGVSIKG